LGVQIFIIDYIAMLVFLYYPQLLTCRLREDKLVKQDNTLIYTANDYVDNVRVVNIQ
jgi:hypothetical protein